MTTGRMLVGVVADAYCRPMQIKWVALLDEGLLASERVTVARGLDGSPIAGVRDVATADRGWRERPVPLSVGRPLMFMVSVYVDRAEIAALDRDPWPTIEACVLGPDGQQLPVADRRTEIFGDTYEVDLALWQLQQHPPKGGDDAVRLDRRGSLLYRHDGTGEYTLRFVGGESTFDWTFAELSE